MDNKKQITINVLFFGAGKKGRYWLERSRDLGIVPKGILDNKEDLWETVCDDIVIYNPNMIKTFHFEYIFITCNKEKEIVNQLLELGVTRNKIVSGNHNILNHLLYYVAKNITSVEGKTEFRDDFMGGKILFDLYNGMVLGGVESWSYALAKNLARYRYQGMYLTTDAAGPVMTDQTYPVDMLKYSGIEKDKDKVERCVQEITKNLPCTILCNFPQYIFWSACIAKQLYPDQIKIIAIQHSDDQPYYNVYSLWQDYIDKCMVISSQIKEKLLSFGMNRTKVGHLKWNISCKEIMNRTWSKNNTCIQIGYAGRITVFPKRIDLFFTLAQKLKRRNIDFQINIAGAGDYSEILQKRIQEKKFQDTIIVVGYIDRKYIPDFWKKQDIMLSCSEWEGHSISQSEAMAGGAVPVITDVSGARDDVTDGYNGFVVDIGDIETMADKVCYLYHNRDVLKQMGIRAHDTIYNRQKNMDQGIFWDDLLKKVWQQ